MTPLIAGDDPRTRINKIADLVGSYDIIFFQENWIFSTEELEKKLPGHQIVSSEKSKFFWPFNTFINSNGSGLTIAISKSIDVMDKKEISYSECSGWLGEANDCLATKGALYTRINFDGREIDLYNTHLDAGDSSDDKNTRVSQVLELDAFIKSHSSEVSVILAGDLNVNFFDLEFETIDKFAEGLNLHTHRWIKDKQIRAEILDYIFYRGTDNFDFNLFNYKIDTNLNSLSDHPAIAAKINLIVRN